MQNMKMPVLNFDDVEAFHIPIIKDVMKLLRSELQRREDAAETSNILFLCHYTARIYRQVHGDADVELIRPTLRELHRIIARSIGDVDGERNQYVESQGLGGWCMVEDAKVTMSPADFAVFIARPDSYGFDDFKDHFDLTVDGAHRLHNTWRLQWVTEIAAQLEAMGAAQ